MTNEELRLLYNVLYEVVFLNYDYKNSKDNFYECNFSKSTNLD